MNALWTGEPSVIYGNVRNEGLIDNLRRKAAWKVWLVWWMPAAFNRRRSFSSGGGDDADQHQRANAVDRSHPHGKPRSRVSRVMDPHTAAVLGIEEILRWLTITIAARRLAPARLRR